MTLLNDSRWRLWKPKPISSKGTARALAVGDAVFKRTGVNQNLKDGMLRAILADRQRSK